MSYNFQPLRRTMPFTEDEMLDRYGVVLRELVINQNGDPDATTVDVFSADSDMMWVELTGVELPESYAVRFMMPNTKAIEGILVGIGPDLTLFTVPSDEAEAIFAPAGLLSDPYSRAVEALTKRAIAEGYAPEGYVSA
jgi:hypothetical protein